MTDYITFEKYSTLMNKIVGWMVKNDSALYYTERDIYGYYDSKAGKVRTADAATIKAVALDRYNNQVWGEDGLVTEFLEAAIIDNNDLDFLPQYVTCPECGEKFYKDEFVDMANRVCAYETLHGESPLIVYRAKETHDVNTTFGYFSKKFGTPGSIDDALSKIRGRGYGYYYDSQFSNKTAIDRMYNRQGVNCTDSAQVFYRLGEALGYQVQFVHVKCKGGDGHIRLRLNKGNGWFYRDPAAVLDGECIECNWCNPPAYTIAYDPSWIFADLER